MIVFVITIPIIERQNVEEQNKFVEEYEEMGRYVKEQNAALEYALLQVLIYLFIYLSIYLSIVSVNIDDR